MPILSINAGSSSLKLALFDDDLKLLVKSSLSNINTPPTKFSTSLDSQSTPQPDAVKNQDSALEFLLDHISAVSEAQNISHICHRVVHGGNYKSRVLITDETLHHLNALAEFATLHNAPAVSLIRACLKRLPKSKSIAYFDTTFHASIPRHIFSYPIDPVLAEKHELRKYGFHGISYDFIISEVTQFLHKDPAETNLIILHLGSGASVCCIQKGKSLDTSMGLTPVDGLPGATRTGSVDPSLVIHYLTKTKSDLDTAEHFLNSEAGWKALTGTSSFEDISKSDEEKIKIAFALFIDRIVNYLGAYYLKLRGQVHAVVFSGGIGEVSTDVWEAICDACYDVVGIRFDKDQKLESEGSQQGPVRAIGDGRVKTLVCKTNEELNMARSCRADTEFFKSPK